MSATGTDRTIFGDETGTDGRGIADIDLNAISTNSTRRAWEVPGWADLLAFDRVGTGQYNDHFTNAGGAFLTACKQGVFTKGPGLIPSIGGSLATVIGAGFLGVWNETTPAPPLVSGVPKMAWGYVSGADSVTHDAEGAGSARWDLVYCSVTEADTTAVLRHWEDAVTMAKTTESVVAAKRITFTFGITKGTPQTDDSEVIPSVAAGTHALYAVHVSEGAVDQQLDLTVPYGPLRKVLQPAQAACYDPTGWAVLGATGALTSLAGSAYATTFYPPGEASGSGDVRILGVRISYLLEADSRCKIGTIVQDTTRAFTSITDLASLLTMNGVSQTTFIDLRGLPSVATLGPYWTSGAQKKADISNIECTGIALQIQGPDGGDAGGNQIHSVEWFYVGA